MASTAAAAHEPVRRGASDLLRIAPSDTGDEANAEYELIREHIANHDDGMLHFSGEVVEIVDATPTTRIICVTDKALYKFPTSAIQTGLFFDARFPLEKLVQIVAVDNDDKLQGHGLSGLDAQVYVSSDSGSTILAFTLNFANFPARRQAFFLSLSLVKPGIPILLKRRVSDAVSDDNNNQSPSDRNQQQQEASAARNNNNNNASPSASRKVPHYMQNTKSRTRSLHYHEVPSTTFGNSIGSPIPKAPSPTVSRSNNNTIGKNGNNNNNNNASQSKATTAQSNNYSPAKFRDLSAGDNGSKSNSPPQGIADDQQQQHQVVLGSAVNTTAKEVSGEEFERSKKQLHLLLNFDLDPSNQLDMLDPGWKTTQRPPEESMERIAERDEVRAMIYAKEDKIELDARFREKNPKKALTKFARGVCLEFDKAHEERFVPPELSDEMLLGPALYPLWKQWKASGGLLKIDRSGGDDEDHQWTLFDTNDLISSIRAQEDALLGQIGKKSMFRLQQMRELVEREKKMFMNRKSTVSTRNGRSKRGGVSDYDDDDDVSDLSSSAGRSPYGSRKPTKPIPFRLSCSANLESQVKRTGIRAQESGSSALDLGQVMKTMKDGLMVHRAKLHDLQKTQLVREINRHAGM